MVYLNIIKLAALRQKALKNWKTEKFRWYLYPTKKYDRYNI